MSSLANRSWLSWELLVHKICNLISTSKADTLFATLTINHAHINARGPIIIVISLRWLALSSIFLFQDLLTIRGAILGREAIVIVYVILILLHVIPATSVNSLLVSIIWIIATVPLSLSRLLTT